MVNVPTFPPLSGSLTRERGRAFWVVCDVTLDRGLKAQGCGSNVLILISSCVGSTRPE